MSPSKQRRRKRRAAIRALLLARVRKAESTVRPVVEAELTESLSRGTSNRPIEGLELLGLKFGLSSQRPGRWEPPVD